MTPMKSNLLWLDTETTGLRPEHHNVIQIAVAATDPDLNIIAEQEWVIRLAPAGLSRIDKVPFEMHTKSGLLNRALYGGDPPSIVYEEVERFALTHCSAKPYLAGNSIHFDYRFLTEEAPWLLSSLHYRMLDVSAFKVAAEVLGLPAYPKPEPAHTALADIRGSIAEFKHWRRVFAEAGGQ